jgi:hypothetical protein
MPFVVRDRVKETSTTTGTGFFTLSGAVTGFQSFSVIGDANNTFYCITDQVGSNWEVGIGTYALATTRLSRDTVLSSSNAGSLVNFGAGIKEVFCTYPSGRSVYVDGSTIVAPNSGVLPAASGGTGLSSTPANGQLNIGNGTGFTRATLTAGTGLAVTNGAGSITVNAPGTTINSQTAAYTLVAADAGKTISITTGGVTVPASVLAAGSMVTIYNNSGTAQTITQGASLTLQWAGQTASTTGNRTLGLYGIATIVYITTTNAVISGAGLT